jgi:hypothetical protein
MGATKKRGEKKLSLEEFLPIFAQVRQKRVKIMQFSKKHILNFARSKSRKIKAVLRISWNV